MSDTLIQTTENIQPKERTEALKLHNEIITSGEMACYYLSELGMKLKDMRDKKLYTALGHDSFEEYVVKMIGIKVRQAYTYISTYEKLGNTFLQSNAQLGITKLSLLTEVPDIERADFVEDNDLEHMSTREIKELIAKSKEQSEQISFLTEQVEESKQVKSDIDTLAAERDMLLLQVSELENHPVEVAVAEPSASDIAKITSDLKKQFEADKKLAIENAEATAIAKAKKEYQKLIDDAVERAKSDKSDEIKKALEQADKEKSELLAKAEKLARELSAKGDADIVQVSVLFDGMKEQYNKLIQKISDIMQQDKDKGMNLAGAVHKYLTDIAAPAIHEISGDNKW